MKVEKARKTTSIQVLMRKEDDEEKDDEVSQPNVTNPEQLRTLESEHKPES